MGSFHVFFVATTSERRSVGLGKELHSQCLCVGSAVWYRASSWPWCFWKQTNVLRPRGKQRNVRSSILNKHRVPARSEVMAFIIDISSNQRTPTVQTDVFTMTPRDTPTVSSPGIIPKAIGLNVGCIMRIMSVWNVAAMTVGMDSVAQFLMSSL